MKHMTMMFATAWGAMILEQSRPNILPAGSILLPLVIVSIMWNRSAGGMFSGGVVLILDWIVRPQGWPLLPLLPVVLTLGATILLSRTSDDPWTGRRAPGFKIPEWTQPLVLVVVGMGLITGPAIIVQQTSLTEALHVIRAYAIVSLPLCLFLTGLMKLAGEFGFRRSTQLAPRRS
ncbi:MAG: hypothetical protein ABGZ35_09215 [Planctomycetaceae bacterium]|jgi:hypothetical protein